jgi:hypothetical protein
VGIRLGPILGMSACWEGCLIGAVSAGEAGPLGLKVAADRPETVLRPGFRRFFRVFGRFRIAFLTRLTLISGST